MKIIFIRLFLVLSSTIFTILFCQWISEKFFFDKFYYKKSIEYGYDPTNRYVNYNQFGKRAQDLVTLNSIIHDKQSVNKPILDNVTHSTYNIAVIGDSFVWGEGIKNNDRFAEILETKLNKILPTKIFSFGRSGDGLVDNYIKYKIISGIYPKMNLYIFGILDNDLMLTPDKSIYNEFIYNELLGKCNKSYIYDPVFLYNQNPEKWKITYYEAMDRFFDDQYGNLCLLKYIATQLPKENALYYSFFTWNSFQIDKITQEFKTNNLKTLNPTHEYISKFLAKPSDYFVSNMEQHPSSKANQMFAEQLYDYIVKNGYIPKK